METHENSMGDIPLDQLSMKLGHLDTLIQTGVGIDTRIHSLFNSVKSIFGFSNSKKLASRSDLSKKYLKLKQELPGGEIPKAFDSRKQWPDCIHGMRDQQLCGSCWAFASSGFMSDRFCIHSQGQINEILSPQDLVSCSFENFGCNGGQLAETVDYIINEGIVSETCKPYMNQDSYCEYKCSDSSKPYTKYFCQEGSLTILADREEIKLELMTNGPMMVGLSVYEDFMNYKEGVYRYTVGQVVGGHAIKIIGWDHDEEDGQLYWICQNQWGSAWGMEGYVNIKAGELGLDTMVIGCMPDIEEVKK